MIQNVFTKGTKGVPISGDLEKSQELIPSNEDWAMIVEVSSVVYGVVAGTKIWDQGTPKKTFYARLEYFGQAGTPPDSSIVPGQRAVFYRVGAYNSQGKDSYELNTEKATGTSFVCFVQAPLVYIYDLGNGTGYQAEFVSSAWQQVAGSAIYPLVTLDPISQYHNSTPPFAEGRIYRGSVGAGFYLVDLPGHGPVEKTLVAYAGSVEYDFDVDGQGNLLTFSAYLRE